MAKKRNPNFQAWKERNEAKAKADGYAVPADMVERSEHAMLSAEWHLYPWKNGTWVNVEGTIYKGNGGNQREEHYWFTKGPWLLIPEIEIDRLDGPYKSRYEAANRERDRLGAAARKAAAALVAFTEDK